MTSGHSVRPLQGRRLDATGPRRGRIFAVLTGRRGVTSLVVAAMVAALVGLTPGVAEAATLTVTSTADVAANFGACGTPGQTTSSGSLREAVCAANNAGATSTTITVAAGTYTLTNGELQMGKVSGSNITLNGAGAGSTIISGNNASRVFDLDPSIVGGVTTSISGVTITNGAVPTFGGAGIIAGSGHATTRDTLTVSNSTISNNHINSTTTNKLGGGLEFQGGSLTITNSTFSGNTAGSSSGSAVEYDHEDNAPGEQLSISGTTFAGNTTNASVANINVGGALHTTGVTATTPMSVTNSVFTANTVVGSGSGITQGGAIFAEGNGSLTVNESTFTGNSVAGGLNTSGGVSSGGAIAVLGVTANLHYNRFTGNTAANGSAVAMPYPNNGSSVNATDNWWGCNTGPGTAGCDTVFGGPTVSPRLLLMATAGPATMVGPNATSTITAALTTDSLGGAIAAANLDAFAGLPVKWTDPLPSGATLGAASTNLSSGSASTTYNSQNSSGPGHVLATLDNGTATALVTVNRPPAITSTNTAAFTVGTAATLTVTTTGYPAAAITKTGTVPPGMTFVDNGNGTATLAGTPTAGGSYPLSLTANNGVNPNATQTLTVTVSQAPAFTNANTVSFTAGTAGSFTVTSNGYPTAAITRTGTLPTGMSFLDNGNGTATLSGTPTVTGSFPLSLTASNGVNPNATQTLTVTVTQPPAFTSATAATFAVGTAGSFSVTTNGYPTPGITEIGTVPAGLSFVDNGNGTATLSGTPNPGTAGTSAISLTAANGIGPNATQSLTIVINEAPAITTNPSSQTVNPGDSVSFTAAASGTPAPTVQWQRSTDGGTTFTDVTGATGTTYTFTAATGDTGNEYRAVFTNAANRATTTTATLTVNRPPTITSADAVTFKIGTASTFTVTTTGSPPAKLTIIGTLPDWVTFTDKSDGTATISGTPPTGSAGPYHFTITADNGTNPAANQAFTLTSSK